MNPFAIRVMAEVGVDIGGQTSKSPDAFVAQEFDLVVTVCSNTERSCPRFANARRHEHWPFDDPAEATGTDEAKLAVFRRVRDQIDGRVRAFLAG